jgi:hypothetical protein
VATQLDSALISLRAHPRFAALLRGFAVET